MPPWPQQGAEWIFHNSLEVTGVAQTFVGKMCPLICHLLQLEAADVEASKATKWPSNFVPIADGMLVAWQTIVITRWHSDTAFPRCQPELTLSIMRLPSTCLL